MISNNEYIFITIMIDDYPLLPHLFGRVVVDLIRLLPEEPPLAQPPNVLKARRVAAVVVLGRHRALKDVACRQRAVGARETMVL
jgi:hypothetical protein